MQEPSGPGIRNDCGVYAGFQVPVEYDPILSKLVVWAEDRALAVRRMTRALQNYVILGIKTPIPFLIDVLNSKPFQSGATYTDFIDAHFDHWQPATSAADLARIAYIAHALWAKSGATAPVCGARRFASPFETLGLWRR
jgi:acetyl/propionyl-CoA carboxylase alpha subunit